MTNYKIGIPRKQFDLINQLIVIHDNFAAITFKNVQLECRLNEDNF